MADEGKRAKSSIYNNTKNYTPKLGDVVLLMACCGAGPRWVMRHLAPAYKCQACKREPRSVGQVTLGVNGALPELEASVMVAEHT